MSDVEDEKVVRLDSKRKRKRARPQQDEPAWLDRCVVGETGKPLAVLASAMVALRAEMPETFAYDEMLCAPLLMKALKTERASRRDR